MFNNFFSEDRAVYEIMLKNDVTIWCLRVACWVSKVTRAKATKHTHTHRQIYHTYCFFTAKII